ncbi:MAG: hypothetical protein JKY32_01275 [Rhizobiales bacterium]|nr:hypothetical protein [Hyphomicrobiales bacterium]
MRNHIQRNIERTKTTRLKTLLLSGAVLTGAIAVLATGPVSTMAAQEATIITLTQVGCQFLESENDVDHGFVTKSAEDCVEINGRTGEQRLSESRILNLPPGRYIFRVENRNVPYPLGFWLREHDYQPGNPIHLITKTSISGGGLDMGTTLDYEVELEAGTQYVYSCPLNPTPNYSIVVN